MHAILHYLDVIAPAFTIGGVWLIGRDVRAGWLVSSVGTVLWLTSGLLATYGGRPMWGLVANSVVMLGLNGWAWWRRRPTPATKNYPWPGRSNVYVPPTSTRRTS